MIGKSVFRYSANVMIILFLIICCSEKNEESVSIDLTPYHLKLPIGFPELVIPKNNQLTQARVALGKKLFYDPILSRDSTVSCASCHRQVNAFTDPVPISAGVEGRRGFRNAPTLTNVAYLGRLNKDGGVVKLGMQAVVPIEDKDEMDFPLLEAAARLRKHPEYMDLSLIAYGRVPDPFTITRALAAFERTFISGNSSYDQYAFQGNKTALTASELRGMKLFFSDSTNCSACHSGFNFTNNRYENNGLQEEYPEDQGRKRITLQPKDQGKFRVPTLRNVELTAPYMHDGRIASLETVIEHYNSGGSQHPNKNELIRQRLLNGQQKEDLVSFLKTLTDSSFIQNPAFRPLGHRAFKKL